MMQLRNPEICSDPQCGGDSKVMDSRKGEVARWRRRKCLKCGRLWRTYESLIDPEMIALKPPAIHKM
jgi:transcriptional regulator NrdR family protein